MDFEKQKKLQLKRRDFSKKGEIDRPIKSLVKKINQNKNYYTTSSCSGRIVILTEGKKKHDAEWFFVSHGKIREIKLSKLPKEPLWFKFEPMILHVACRTMEDAQGIVDKAKQSGFKHSGIMATSNRIIAEIRGTDFISTIISKGNKLAIDKKYLRLLTTEANKKLERNFKKIRKFKQMVS